MLRQTEAIAGLGTRTDVVAPAPGGARLVLTPPEQAVLGAVGRAARIEEVIARTGLPESETVAHLLALRAKGAIRPARLVETPTQGLASAALQETVDLPDERKREILAREALIEAKADHFAFLGISPAASDDELRNAYFEASRLFHPDRYFGRELGSFRARLDQVFRRLAEAHAVLSDPARRATYLAAHPHLRSRSRAAPRAAAPAPAPAASAAEQAVATARHDERRSRLTRHPYLVRGAKLNEMIAEGKALVARGEVDRGLQRFQKAEQIAPAQDGLRALILDARKRQDSSRAEQEMARGAAALREGDHPTAAAAFARAASMDPSRHDAAQESARWILQTSGDLNQARAFAQRAVELKPEDGASQALLGTVYHRLGMNKLAKRHLELAVERDPKQSEAKRLLRQLR